MKVYQLLTTVSFGDAVGNDTLALRDVIAEMGYDTGIFAENIDQRLPRRTALPVEKMPKLSKEDVLIYHKSTGTDLSFRLEQFSCRKIMIYHNITPPEFFEPYSPDAAALTRYGLEGVRHLKDTMDYCLAVSAFNRQNLREMGYTCPIDVRPILIPFADYDKTPDQQILRQYMGDGWTNLVFVGRIAPNKCHENVIRTFYQYQKINPKSRLFLVGSYTGMEAYYGRLQTYVKALGLTNVIFTGHIKFDQILAYYRAADVFVCMSEHEGFCVPLCEAMHFDLPIVAYHTSAIGDTLGGSGILLENNNPLEAAMVIDRVVRDADLRERILEGQRKRLEDFRYEKIKALFTEYLQTFIHGGTA